MHIYIYICIYVRVTSYAALSSMWTSETKRRPQDLGYTNAGEPWPWTRKLCRIYRLLAVRGICYLVFIEQWGPEP